jgi:hypothetical protein
MLDNSFPHLESEIQTAKRCVSLLEILHNPQRMQIVIEGKPMPPHCRIEGFLSRVSEWRVADIVYQSESFDQINIQSKLCRDGAGNLRNFEGMRQPVPEVIRVPSGEYLGLRLKPAKGSRMDYAVAVSLKIVAVGMRWLRIAPPPGVFHLNRIRGQQLAH